MNGGHMSDVGMQESDVTAVSPAAGALIPEIYETHTGLVILIGGRAYKSKKAISTDFLDFSSVERRESACLREIELNCRLAPDAYLGLAHLNGPEPGEVEPVVVMRRYPESARLSNRVRCADDAELTVELKAVAQVLAGFHETACRGADVDAEGTASAVAQRWQANMREMAPFVGTVFPDGLLWNVAELAHRYTAGRSKLFAERIRDGRIVDGHADLLADDIFCCADGPILLDCLDFDDRLRYVDGIDDATFLAMDLEYLGRADLGARFLAYYRTFANDSAPASLADFYLAYRAVVRSKVDCIRFTQGHREAAGEAQHHLQIAADHLRTAVPRLVLVGGGPGTGKTTLSDALAENIGAQAISTDRVRKELLGTGEIDGPAGMVDSGLYTPANVAAVYDEVLARASRALSGGCSVILDGTWRDPAQRLRTHELGARTESAVVEMVCVAPLDTAQQRIAHRTGSASDATGAIAAALSDRAGGDGGWEGAYRIDTGRPLPDTVAEAALLCHQALLTNEERGERP